MKPGDHVTIMTGPYAGQQGAIIGIPRKNTLVKLTTGIPVTVPAKALKGSDDIETYRTQKPA